MNSDKKDQNLGGIIGLADDRAVQQQVQSLLAGGAVVALPTETVYGLAADATLPDAVARIFATKGRPAFNPLICHVAGLSMARRYASFSPTAEKLAAEFWPGPLTMVLPLVNDAGLAPAVTAGLNNVGLRCPASPLMLSLITALDKPLAAPSANPSGKLSPTTAADLVNLYGHMCPPIVDGGATSVGIESTIISVTNGAITLLRPGTITAAQIEAVTHVPVRTNSDGKITAPGQLKSHYAPALPVVRNITQPTHDAVHIGFAEQDGEFNLSPAADLAEAAQNLYAVLAKADARGKSRGASAITIAPIPAWGIGLAINDRLARAAAPRPKDTEPEA